MIQMQTRTILEYSLVVFSVLIIITILALFFDSQRRILAKNPNPNIEIRGNLGVANFMERGKALDFATAQGDNLISISDSGWVTYVYFKVR